MEKHAKIFIAGHRGMVGSAIFRRLSEKGYTNIITRSHAELDLTDQKQTEAFFAGEKPDYVFLAAAKVGGIMANNVYRAQFIYENLMIQNNIIHHSYLNGVKKLLFLGSSCIYPKACPQPIKEEYLLTDILEYTNEPYAIAKITGIKTCESYNIQYGTNFISVMPTNLYGPNDNYDLEKSHVLPALIRKMHLGKALERNDLAMIRRDLNNYPVEGTNGQADESVIFSLLEKYGIVKDQQGRVKINLWGTGKPRREFLHADDMADACVFIMESLDFEQLKESSTIGEIRNTHINIGVGSDQSIKELADLIQSITGFEGEIAWDTNKPDGTFQKLLNVDKLHSLGWKERITLKEGIRSVYENYAQA